MTKTQRSDTDIQDALARSITARLQDGVDVLPHDITERLKVARLRALAQRKPAMETSRVLVSSTGQARLHWGAGFGHLMTQLGSWLPLLVLVTGLVVIGIAQDDTHTQELADVDAELLTDALPPAAYSDPGFAQFLRNNLDK